MRFEIKTGGAILILIGLLGLSVVVVAFGIYAGYDMARSTAPEAPQTASVYPLPSPPTAPDLAKAPVRSSDQAAMTHAASNAPATKTKPADSAASSLAMDKDVGPVT